MFFESLQDSLIYIRDYNFKGVMNIVYMDEVEWRNCIANVDRLMLQPFRDQGINLDSSHEQINLTTLEIKRITLISKTFVAFKPDLPKFLLDDLLKDVLKKNELSQPLYQILVDAVSSLMGEEFISDVKTIVDFFPPSSNPQGFIEACNHLIEPKIEVVKTNNQSQFITSVTKSSLESELVAKLEQQAIQLLGSKGGAKVRHYAQKHSSNEKTFLAACRKVFAIVLGPKAIDKLFSDIDEAINIKENMRKATSKANEILGERLGMIGFQIATRIAQNYSPDSHLEEFLQQCIIVVTLVDGKNHAEMLFQAVNI